MAIRSHVDKNATGRLKSLPWKLQANFSNYKKYVIVCKLKYTKKQQRHNFSP